MAMTNAEWMIKKGYKFGGLSVVYEKSEEDDGHWVWHIQHLIAGIDEISDVACINVLTNWLDAINVLTNWLDAEHKEPILDESERQYLSAVIRPFRDDVQYIVKCDGNGFRNFEDIIVNYKYKPCDCADAFFDLPPFKKGTMYKGMKLDKKYTLKELGL